LVAARTRAEQAGKALALAIDEFEKALSVALQLEKIRENAGLEDWNEPTQDEYLEDQREDERVAREDTKVCNQWVPPDILEVSIIKWPNESSALKDEPYEAVFVTGQELS